MAIIVKGKFCLCKTSLADWNPERVNGILFYDRYQDFVKLFSAKIPEVDFERCFAQPVFNDETNAIEWFGIPMEEYPSSLQEIPDPMAESEKRRITTAIEQAARRLNENDRKYIAPILLTLQSDKVDSVTYHYKGKVVFGVWGMIMKKGKVISDIIIDDIKDHRTHHVTYNVKGNGSVLFSDIVRRHGHVLTGEADVPAITPAEGYKAKEWLPESPNGVKVDRPLQFTIVFEEDRSVLTADDSEKEEAIVNNGLAESTEDKQVGSTPEVPQKNVRFTSDERGVLHGPTVYDKRVGERVLAIEIPQVEAKYGYRFIGWDKQPIDYVVNEETVFTAQYEPIQSSAWGGWWWLSGCLNWLLTLLLLLLIGLLLWFLLGRHNLNFCGGDCNDCKEEIVIHDTIIVNDTIGPNPNPIQSPCNEETRNGSNHPESYVFDMKQQSGEFLFEYATGNYYGDRIIVYDGKNRNNVKLLDFKGITGNCPLGNADAVQKLLHFSNRYILVDVIPDTADGTCWSFKVNCPQ